MGSKGERQQARREKASSRPSMSADNPHYRQAKTGRSVTQPEELGLPHDFGTNPPGPTSFDEAHQSLKDAASQGGFACDWGCTLSVQSRGCKGHAQLIGKI